MEVVLHLLKRVFLKTIGFGNHRLCRGSLCAFKALV